MRKNNNLGEAVVPSYVGFPWRVLPQRICKWWNQPKQIDMEWTPGAFGGSGGPGCLSGRFPALSCLINASHASKSEADRVTCYASHGKMTSLQCLLSGGRRSQRWQNACMLFKVGIQVMSSSSVTTFYIYILGPKPRLWSRTTAGEVDGKTTFKLLNHQHP